MPSPRAHFVSFANRRYQGALARIRREADGLGRFASVTAVDERFLAPDYWRRHAVTVRRHRRGYGLWTWKPHVVGNALDAAAPGDVVVYADAGCSLNAEGRPRLEEYLEIATGHASGVLGFALDGMVGFRPRLRNYPQSTSTASDGIPRHGADGPREERFQGRSAPTRKIRP